MNRTRIKCIVRYFRESAESHRATFTRATPVGGNNAKLFDLWADEIEKLLGERDRKVRSEKDSAK